MNFAVPTYDSVESFDSNYIGGEWVPSERPVSIPVEAPALGRVVAHVPASGPRDVDRAVRAATAASPVWSATKPVDRARVLRALRDALLANQEVLASLIAIEVGSPIKSGRYLHVGMAAESLEAYAAAVESFDFEHVRGNSQISHHSVTVAGAITPWNYPLSQVTWKIGAAIAAGAPVVLKPSEIAPLTAMYLARIWQELDLPAGVLNIVPGHGALAGQSLVENPGVGAVSFTGSTAVGREVAATAGRRLIPATLELGGKSASIVWAEELFSRAVKSSVMSSMLNAGQTCSAWTRLIVPDDRLEEATHIAVEAAAKLRIGDPLDESTSLGPLVSGLQRERVRDIVRSSIAEGTTLAFGDLAAHSKDDGYFISPFVFTNVRSEMEVSRREIFGPVLAIQPASDLADAVRQANDSAYGLSGAVWCDDSAKAIEIASCIDTGQVYVNGARYNPNSPFGGWKDSGLGREWGSYGMEEFLQVKSIQADVFDASGSA